MSGHQFVDMLDICFSQYGPGPCSPDELYGCADRVLCDHSLCHGMQEFNDTPSNGADKSCMTLNLSGTFLARRPSGDITYDWKIDPRKGQIILLALSSFVSFSSTSRGLASAISLFPFTVLMLACLSYTI